MAAECRSCRPGHRAMRGVYKSLSHAWNLTAPRWAAAMVRRQVLAGTAPSMGWQSGGEGDFEL